MSNNPAPPSSTSRMGRIFETITSDSGSTLAPWSRLSLGYCSSSCRAIVFMLARAVATVTPSLSRATPLKLWQLRRRAQESEA